MISPMSAFKGGRSRVGRRGGNELRVRRSSSDLDWGRVCGLETVVFIIVKFNVIASQ